MTKPFITRFFEVITASAALDATNVRRGVVNFSADAHFYSFSMDRTTLLRLGQQIQRVLQEIPPPPRKRSGA